MVPQPEHTNKVYCSKWCMFCFSVTLFFSKSCGDETVRGVKNTNPPSLYNEPKVVYDSNGLEVQSSQASNDA